METLKVLKIAIKEWIFIVPLYFERERAAVGRVKMVDLMANRLFLNVIDDLFYFDVPFTPFQFMEAAPQTLRQLGLTATTPNDLGDGKADLHQCIFQSLNNVREVDAEDCLSMGSEFGLKSGFAETVEHYSAAIGSVLL